MPAQYRDVTIGEQRVRMTAATEKECEELARFGRAVQKRGQIAIATQTAPTEFLEIIEEIYLGCEHFADPRDHSVIRSLTPDEAVQLLLMICNAEDGLNDMRS